MSEMKTNFEAAMEAQARSDTRDELREKRKAAVEAAQAKVEDTRKNHKAACNQVLGGDGDGGYIGWRQR